MDQWSESYQNTNRGEEGNNVREEAMAEQIRLSLVLSASFHFIIEDHMMGKQRQTLTMLYISAHF